MRLGDMGYEVGILQDFLIERGYLAEREYNFGVNTKLAVIAVQQKLGYEETGEWDDSLYLLLELDSVPAVRARSNLLPTGYVRGDLVTIVGDDAVYGGESEERGLPIPENQKGRVYTVEDVSTRQELLLREIYLWVPIEFIEMYADVPSGTATSDLSEVSSSIITQEQASIPETTGSGGIRIDAISCYVLNHNTGTRTEFYAPPESISEDMSANYDDQAPKSRSSPFKAYSGSGSREISFTVTLYDDYCPLGIMQTVRNLQALTVPSKGGGYILPPSCYVRVGSFISAEAVCNSVGVAWETPYKSEIYSKAEVSLSFSEVQATSVYADQWEAGV